MLGPLKRKSLRRFAFTLIALFALTGTTMSGTALAANAPQVDIKETAQGSGAMAERGDKITVHYTGWLLTGKEFDSSRGRDPLAFTLGGGQVIPGWEQGVEGMQIGGKRELVIPPQLAYGPKGAGDLIPPNATLKFEVELVSVEKAPWTNVDNQGLKDLIAQGVTLVDIRRPDEWQKTGVVQGAKTITLFEKGGRTNRNFIGELSAVAGPNDKVALICRSGNRTIAAAGFLAKRLGYTNIYNVKNGMNGWLAEKNPTVPPGN